MNEYLTEAGEQALTEIKRNYQFLLNEVISQFPSLKVLTYGYDYPRPLVGGGTWIGQHLQELGIPDNLMNSIMACVLDRLNMVIKEAGNTYEKVHYLDCRHVTTLYPWHDDMHPSSEGFAALAKKFEDTMDAWSNEGKS